MTAPLFTRGLKDQMPPEERLNFCVDTAFVSAVMLARWTFVLLGFVRDAAEHMPKDSRNIFR